MNHPTVTLHVDGEDLDRASVQFMFYDQHPVTGHMASVNICGAKIITQDGVSVSDLAAAFERLAGDLRSTARRITTARWSMDHPEQPRPLNHGGACDGCETTTDQLFAVTVIGSSGEQDMAVCASCGTVDYVDELGHPTRLDPDEDTDVDRRADLHDAGIDEVAA